MKTRSQAASKSREQPHKTPISSHSTHISKPSKDSQPVGKKSKVGKAKSAQRAGGGRQGRSEPKPIVYNESLVNLNIIKKFDAEAVIDQTGNSNGDTFLPRATLNQIIKESLPSTVRAQKESMELICFISNAFVDLLADISNNVCCSSNKKNIIQEHAIRAIQELSLDDYLPYLLVDDQYLTMAEIEASEQKRPMGLQIDFGAFKRGDWTQEKRDIMVTKLRARLEDSDHVKERKRMKKRKAKNSWMNGLTPEEIERRQKEIFDNISSASEDSDPFQAGSESNQESLKNSNVPDDKNGGYGGEEYAYDPYAQHAYAQQQPHYDDAFKADWIQHNRQQLDQDYEQWVQQYLEYNRQMEQQGTQGLITDEANFKAYYPPEGFYEQQYAEFMNQCQPPEYQQQYHADYYQQQHAQTQPEQAPVETQNATAEQHHSEDGNNGGLVTQEVPPAEEKPASQEASAEEAEEKNSPSAEVVSEAQQQSEPAEPKEEGKTSFVPKSDSSPNKKVLGRPQPVQKEDLDFDEMDD